MKTLLAMLAALFMALAPALVGDLEDGMEAYDGGDYAQALAAWTRAAAAGRADAMTALAGLYENGTGVARDSKTALIWYRRGARLGDVASQFNLGDMIARGQGQERDPVEASMWLGLAAAQGNLWAAERKRELDRTLTADQAAEADRRIGEWRLP
jgi:TPR repeat protein